MKTKNYLKNTAKHLFEISFENGDKQYMKLIVMDDKYKILKFDSELNLIKSDIRDIIENVSINKKPYVAPYLRKSILFYAGYAPNKKTYKSIKHFKAIKEKIIEIDGQV